MEPLEIIVIVLFLVIGILIGYIVGSKIAAMRRDKYWEDEIVNHRKDAVQRSRAVLSGNFSEQLAPFLPNFPFKPTEVRFIGKPIDFIVFKGMDEKKIDEVAFVEVKSGNSKLSEVEKSLKEAVEKGKVKWEEYRVDEGVTRGMNRKS
jgi:predicted Holliday junction resolvase-like endonuclease